jgi:hypothetical protein
MPGSDNLDNLLDDSDELGEKSRDELIEIILELKAKMPKATGRLSPDAASVTFGAGRESKPEDYVWLPATGRPAPGQKVVDPVWRVQFISADPKNKPLSMDIHGDVLVGRTAGGVHVDLDLTTYGAAEGGVSRQHALLRPTKSSLFLIDLESTNGTFHNAFKTSSGVAFKLRDNDTVSFGRLHFMVKVISRPE